MGLLDEPALERLTAAGCQACGSGKLLFRAYVEGVLPLQGGEPVGRVTWIYDGEKFVDGVYEIRCGQCDATIFEADVCPRCDAPGGLSRALETPNGWTVPRACPSCDDDQVRYVAFVPARVAFEGKRAEKARGLSEPHENGFHGARVDCTGCGTVAALADVCPLCGGPGPLRTRPG